MPRFFQGLALLSVVTVLSCGGESASVSIAPTPESIHLDSQPSSDLHCRSGRSRDLGCRSSYGFSEVKIDQRVFSLLAEQKLITQALFITAAHPTTTTTTTAVRSAPPAPSPEIPSILPVAGDYHSWPDWYIWRAIGLCEQRGSGRYDTHGDGIAWGGSPLGGLPGSAYPGGLGMSRDFWRMFAPAAGVAIADAQGNLIGGVTNGALATPGDQIRVARVGSHNGTRMRGWTSYPGCTSNYGVG